MNAPTISLMPPAGVRLCSVAVSHPAIGSHCLLHSRVCVHMHTAPSPCPGLSFWCPESSSEDPLCIPRDAVCDGLQDCPVENSDERVCAGTKTLDCRHTDRHTYQVP